MRAFARPRDALSAGGRRQPSVGVAKSLFIELAPYAAHSDHSRGRRYPEPPAAYRSEFQRDRDRIIHSTAFRRLVYKTQVLDRKSTRLNSSHVKISYAVFCLKKK